MLFVGDPAAGVAPRITEYRGSGDLRAWLRVTAMRAARRGENSWSVYTSFCLLGTLVTAPLAILTWKQPTFDEWVALGATSLFAIGAQLRELIAPQAEAVGVQVHGVEVRDVMLLGELRKAFSEVLKAKQEGQAALERATGGDALKPLVAEFDRCWPDVTRTREVLVLAEAFGE